jgi:hypothetical protein
VEFRCEPERWFASFAAGDNFADIQAALSKLAADQV